MVIVLLHFQNLAEIMLTHIGSDGLYFWVLHSIHISRYLNRNALKCVSERFLVFRVCKNPTYNDTQIQKNVDMKYPFIDYSCFSSHSCNGIFSGVMFWCLCCIFYPLLIFWITYFSGSIAQSVVRLTMNTTHQVRSSRRSEFFSASERPCLLSMSQMSS